MTFQEFSRLLKIESNDPMTHAMKMLRDRLTAGSGWHAQLEEEVEGWTWNPDGGGNSLAMS